MGQMKPVVLVGILPNLVPIVSTHVGALQPAQSHKDYPVFICPISSGRMSHLFQPALTIALLAQSSHYCAQWLADGDGQ